MTAAHISEGRVKAMQAAAGVGLVQGPAHGVTLSDLDGNTYIDCRSAGGVFNLGHTRAQIAEVLAKAVQDTDMGDWMLPAFEFLELPLVVVGALGQFGT